MASNAHFYSTDRNEAAHRASARPPKASRLHEMAGRVWSRRFSVTLLVVWLVSVVGFVVLAFSVHAHPPLAFDQRISHFIQRLQGQRETSTLNTIGDLAGPFAAITEYVIILVALMVFRLFREALCAAVSGLSAEGLNIVTNALVKRPRPPTYHSHTIANIGAHSFPSGHTANAVGLYGFLIVLAVFAARAYPKWRPWLAAAIILCVYFIVDIGVSRVIEGQHWPTDVLAGYLLGFICLIIGVALYHRLAVKAIGGVSHRARWTRGTTPNPATT